MRAFLAALAIMPLLAACQRPVASDYWTKASGGQACIGKSKQFESLMAQGTRANLSGQPDAALKLFRDALKEQQTAYSGADNPCTALPRMSLALQLSVAARYEDADAQFTEAQRALQTPGEMTPREYRAMQARLAHYLGVHLLNQKKYAEAEVRLREAQTAYLDPELELVSFDALHGDGAPPRPVRNRFDPNASASETPERMKILSANRVQQPSLLGLIEVLRYRAIALRRLNDLDQAAKLTQAATRLASSNDLGRPSVLARLLLTSGVTATAREGSADARSAELARTAALNDYRRSDDAFTAALPKTKPSAEAALIHADELLRTGSSRAAASLCRRAVETLHSIGAGTTPELMAPCLDAYAAGSSNEEDMFVAAQIAQGSITSHQIAQASAALAESKHNPAIGLALQERDKQQRIVDQLYRVLDTFGPAAAGPAAARVAQLQQQVDQAQTALTRAEQAVRDASPNFSQLVQDVVPASEVYRTLHPGEAFVGFFLSRSSGWVFALRDGHMTYAKIDGGAGTLDPLVVAVRKGLEKVNATSLPAVDIDATRRLYDLTLGAVASNLRGAKSLVVAPTGRLLSVPFEVLLTGPADPTKLADAPWLVRQATITHVPAATNFVSLRKVANSSAASKQWFGFGDFHPVTVAQAQRSFPPGSCGDSGRLLAALPPLPGATKELEAARAVLNASAGDELLGDSFTSDKVLGTPLRDYKVLHFATHAILPTELRCQTEAAVVTSAPPGAQDAGGALLKASQLLDLDLDANLVILSACNSGGPGGGAGESLSGLARSFFFAKARSMMVTHWEVNDQTAALIVVLTINGMKEKPERGVTGALREAQLSLLDKAASRSLPAEIAHPFFWASFAVIGDGGERSGRGTVSSRL